MFIENFQRPAGSLDAGCYHIGFEGVYVCVSVCEESVLLLQVMASVQSEEPRQMWSQLATKYLILA